MINSRLWREFFVSAQFMQARIVTLQNQVDQPSPKPLSYVVLRKFSHRKIGQTCSCIPLKNGPSLCQKLIDQQLSKSIQIQIHRTQKVRSIIQKNPKSVSINFFLFSFKFKQHNPFLSYPKKPLSTKHK
jgi:hypothetical protein